MQRNISPIYTWIRHINELQHPGTCMVRVSAPGKCILFGEHAVVYGKPAVAVAIDARMTIDIQKSDTWKINEVILDKKLHPHLNFLINDMGIAKREIRSITTTSELFPAAGLGSSAALSSALATGLLIETNSPATGDLRHISWMAHMAEAESQGGKASPTDTATSTFGGCVILSDKKEDYCEWMFTSTLEVNGKENSWEIHKIELPTELEDAWLVIGYTGIQSPTSEMVQKVSELLKNEPSKVREINEIEEITKRGVNALANGNLEKLGLAMNECHEVLKSLGVSCKELDEMVDVARESSLGSKMTGAGGGGCMLALTLNPEETAKKIEEMGGKTIISKLGAEGVRIEK